MKYYTFHKSDLILDKQKIPLNKFIHKKSSRTVRMQFDSSLADGTATLREHGTRRMVNFEAAMLVNRLRVI